MTRLKTILGLLLLSITITTSAQITKSEADSLVMNMLSNDSTVVVYSMNECISRSISVYTAAGTELINPNENSYIYFIDDIPAANWTHPCRYCFVNQLDGALSVINDNIYPNNYEVFIQIGRQLERDPNWQWPNTNYTIPTKATPNNKLYAVLIAGDIGLNGALKKAWFNLSCVYTALVNKYGFKEITENDQDYYHIMVCANSEVEGAMTNIGPNGWLPYDLNQSGVFPNHDDFNYTYNNKQDIQLVFQNLSGDDNSLENIPVLNEDDQLFVMLCGVGNATVNDTTVMITRGYNPQYLSDSELATWVRNIKCSQMTFLIDCNYAGGFIDNLMNDALAECKNRAVHTSTDRSHYSWAEQHITQKNYESKSGSGNYVVDEYLYYWSAASLGYYPIIEPYYNDHIYGPWHKYEHTAIGQFVWNTFPSFNEGFGYSHVGYDVNPNTNNDFVLSMEEAFKFADNLDSYSHAGYFHPVDMFQGNDSCVEYPCHAYESSFTKELISLGGYKGKISDDAVTGIGHNYHLSGNVIVGGNSTLTISNNTILHGFNKQLTNAGNIITSQGANNVLFKNLALSNYEGTISLSHCVFDTCGTINTEDGPFSITNSTFNQTSIYAHAYELPRNPYNVVILNDTFNIASNTNAIIIKDIPQCNVTGNTIATGGDGIFLWGLSGAYADYVVNNNNISNCGGSGIVLYASNGSLNGNIITSNDVDGIQSLNLSSPHVTGDSQASSYNQTQSLIYNDRYQVYATNNSYPVDFHYNWLCGSGAPYYLLLYESNYPQNFRPLVFDVTYNNWYPLSDANIPSHLLASGNAVHNYLPTWNPTRSSSNSELLETKLIMANGYVEDGNYDQAIDVYMSVIDNYPESLEAITAMKALFSIEIEMNGDFFDLKDYYLSMINNEYLGDLADNLSNRCDIEMGNYSEAIKWYENKIMNINALYSERIFAEIDLGDLYLKMQKNGIKGIYGDMKEFIPASEDSHAKRADYLLSLLPDGEDIYALENNTNSIENTTIDTRVICLPNPANNKAIISYVLDNDACVEMSLYDVVGNQIRHVEFGKQNDGHHYYELDLSNVKNGLYICKIKTDRNDEEAVKIVVNH